MHTHMNNIFIFHCLRRFLSKMIDLILLRSKQFYILNVCRYTCMYNFDITVFVYKTGVVQYFNIVYSDVYIAIICKKNVQFCKTAFCNILKTKTHKTLAFAFVFIHVRSKSTKTPPYSVNLKSIGGDSVVIMKNRK